MIALLGTSPNITAAQTNEHHGLQVKHKKVLYRVKNLSGLLHYTFNFESKILFEVLFDYLLGQVLLNENKRKKNTKDNIESVVICKIYTPLPSKNTDLATYIRQRSKRPVIQGT